MIRLLISLALLFVVAAPARAELTRDVLDTVSVSLPPEAHLNLALAPPDSHGRMRTLATIMGSRPAFLIFADLTCASLCGSDLRLLAAAIENANLKPWEYTLLVVGIDPKDSAEEAEKLAEAELPTDVRSATVLLMPNSADITRLTTSLGFHYAYDSTLDQFAHPAAIYSIAAAGAVTAVMSPFALDPAALAQTLQTPATRDITFGMRIRILCYQLGAATGIYADRIVDILKFAAFASLILLVAGVAGLWRRGRPPP